MERASSGGGKLLTLVKIEAITVYDIGRSYTLHIVVRNIGEANVTIDSIVLVKPDGTSKVFRTVEPVTIASLSVSNVIAAIPKSEIEAGPAINYKVSVGSVLGISAALTLSSYHFTEAPAVIVYLINVTEATISNWGNPRLIYEELRYKANIKVIRTMNELDALVRNRSPPTVFLGFRGSVHHGF